MADRPGHGDHWLAALAQDDPRMADLLSFPTDAPDGVKLHRRPLHESLDLIQVTARRRLITAYPEPRATTLLHVKPRELLLWDTRVEAWMVAEHVAAEGATEEDAPGAGVLTFFLTDLVENAKRYDAARGTIALEVGALAYTVQRAHADASPSRLRPAQPIDARFLPDDFWFDGEVRAARPAGAGEVLDLAFQNGLELPVATRRATRLAPGERASGSLWLTARWPEEET